MRPSSRRFLASGAAFSIAFGALLADHHLDVVERDARKGLDQLGEGFELSHTGLTVHKLVVLKF